MYNLIVKKTHIGIFVFNHNGLFLVKILFTIHSLLILTKRKHFMLLFEINYFKKKYTATLHLSK